MIDFFYDNLRIISLTIIIFLLSIIAIMRYDSCNNPKKRFISYDEHLKEIRLKDSTNAYQNNVLQATRGELDGYVKINAKLKEIIKESKVGKVNTITNTVIKTTYDTIKTVFKDTIPCAFNPKIFHVSRPFFDLSIKITNKEIDVLKLETIDSLTLIHSVKTHFFKPNEYLVTAKLANPNSRVIGLTSLQIKQEKKWWQQNSTWFSIGAVSAIISMYAINR